MDVLQYKFWRFASFFPDGHLGLTNSCRCLLSIQCLCRLRILQACTPHSSGNVTRKLLHEPGTILGVSNISSFGQKLKVWPLKLNRHTVFTKSWIPTRLKFGACNPQSWENVTRSLLYVIWHIPGLICRVWIEIAFWYQVWPWVWNECHSTLIS